MLHEESLTKEIIGAAIEVHRDLGPGLLESAYEECICYELSARGISFRRQVALPVSFKAVRLDCGYRLDLLVEKSVIVELKCVEELNDLHKAQLLTYLKHESTESWFAAEFQCPPHEGWHRTHGPVSIFPPPPCSPCLRGLKRR